jgi:hypothetical protein
MSRRRPRPSPKRRTIERLSKQADVSPYVDPVVADRGLAEWQESQQWSPYSPDVHSFSSSRPARYSRRWWLFNGPGFFALLFMLMGVSSLLTVPDIVLDIWRQFDPQKRIVIAVVGVAMLLGLGNLVWQVRRSETHIGPKE